MVVQIRQLRYPELCRQEVSRWFVVRIWGNVDCDDCIKRRRSRKFKIVNVATKQNKHTNKYRVSQECEFRSRHNTIVIDPSKGGVSISKP